MRTHPDYEYTVTAVPDHSLVMEAVNENQRQSNIWFVNNREKTDPNCQRYPPSSKNMAAAVALNPSVSSPSEFARHEPLSSIAGERASSLHDLISRSEPWRTSDFQNEMSQKYSHNYLSLPSIREALATKPTSYPSPLSVATPSLHKRPFSQSQSPSVPHMYAPPDRAPSVLKRQRTPQPRNQPNQFAWQHDPKNVANSGSNTLSPAPAAQNPYELRLPVTSYEKEHREVRNGYFSQSAAHQPLNPLAQKSSTPPILHSSHAPPPYPPLLGLSDKEINDYREPRRILTEEDEISDQAQNFRGDLKQNLDIWDFENNLAEIQVSSKALQEWASTYSAIAMDKQPSINATWDRMPSLDSIQDMKKHQEKILNCLEHMARILHEAQQHSERPIVEQKSKEPNSHLPIEYDDDIKSAQSDDVKSQIFVSEARKRRGRAAPPGRCHSCNRAETPEWRRGPDGARTLCNACGLHYAKLTRKSTGSKAQTSSYSSSLPPKSLDVIPRSL